MRSSLHDVRCTIPRSVLCEVALMMLQRGGLGERRGEGSLPSNPLLTARELLAGRHEKEKERGG